MSTPTNKFFVLDTNVLIHNPAALYSFSEHTVVLPITVIEELDKFKTASDKKGMHARQVMREIDGLVRKGALKEGAKIKTGGKLRIALCPEKSVLSSLDLSVNDNKILNCALSFLAPGNTVFFISKDLNSRIKAEALGIVAMDYEKEKVEYTSLYQGWREIALPQASIDALYKDHKLEVSKTNYLDNEYFCIKSLENPNTSCLAKFDAPHNQLVPIRSHFEAMGVKPANLEQQFAFDLLLNDAVVLVSLVGQAGTGKTLIALACGLQQVLGKSPKYEKLLVARPIMPMGKDIGYLPGTKDQKLNYWMQPIFDNLNFIMHKDETPEDEQPRYKKAEKFDKIDYLLESQLLEIEALTYIRGRSIPNQFIIIDEAQNLTPHEIKTIISRAGKGTKIVLTGDAEQIDNPYLDANSNGLSYTAEHLKGQHITGHMFLSKSERSPLATLAAEML
ncbi:MAG: PhoH family protein [Candidatus Margulisiibacteriota bacterium]